MAITAKIDNVTLTTQPSSVEYTPATAVVQQMSDGTFIASKRTYGAVIRWTWGIDASKTDVMQELRSKRNSLVEHAIAFTDPTGTTHTVNVSWLSDPEFKIIPGYVYGAITVTFYQRS